MHTLFLMSSPAGTSGGSAGYMNMLFLVLIFVVMYFFMIRPQAKKAKDQKAFMSSLQKGDKVVTVSGIHGKIIKVNEDGTLAVQIDTNTTVNMERSGLSLEMSKAQQDKK